MQIVDHLLSYDDGTRVPFIKSPNFEGVGQLQPEYLVIHYTAGGSARSAIATLSNPQTKVSAHLVIGRDGSITQLLPFNTIAWHAGVSAWQGRVGLNKYSIGIELDNAGRLGRKGNQWRSTVTGGLYSDAEVLKAKHKNGTGPYGWHLYTEKQIEITLEVALALFRTYRLLDVVGHDDIAPARKTDPGPAFPMESFRAKIFGSIAEPAPQYILSQPALIRINPDSRSKLLRSTYLPKGARLEVLDTHGPWRLVNVLDTIEGAIDLQGWVYAAYIIKILPA